MARRLCADVLSLVRDAFYYNVIELYFIIQTIPSMLSICMHWALSSDAYRTSRFYLFLPLSAPRSRLCERTVFHGVAIAFVSHVQSLSLNAFPNNMFDFSFGERQREIKGEETGG